jgi:exonuclease SbcD
VSLFSGFRGRLKARRPDLELLILPGNHDSSSRLGFGKELFAELGIHCVTEAEDAFRPVLVSEGGKSCAFFLLPFLNPGCLRAELTGMEPEAAEHPAKLPAEPLRSQAKLAEEAAARLEAARVQALAAGAAYTVLGAHLFTNGSAESESERIFLGTAEKVSAGLFQGFDYIALGHLHRFQQAGERAWYSGSPLAYSFEEAEYGKMFLSVELSGKEGPKVEPIPVRPLRKLRTLRGSFDYFFREGVNDPVLAEAEQDYLEIVLTDPGLTENPLTLLRRRFPWILSIRQEAAFAALKTAGTRFSAVPNPGERRGAAEDFADFLSDVYGEEDPEKISAFRELLEEFERTEAVL